ncbi:MAG: transcription termination factor NusA [Sulfurimonas sp. RIFOXYD12_FULL_33_39]|uniref:transcription termination factor NusA n=1 Tax=unclassified Sulfurimonas TaxID=2623549 RepID=UPI0008D2CF92|nr:MULTISPECIES: transcription termination factor NusA [unclassified Sulfurimonas]OHE02393.1 MAG: transcription termination factor NusA [Sulfurimonas sp. RIFCSPLOWO2_12_FULL_34_6]OHE09627.1 MAG: transcription termination factor NusA [Sulfurimonas sp. RIFOXYD12_FULL_33_39]OHE13866.1 MAG: transcription termination factor NusA [Sulfurimonas sp. RIFOXYD2_FULL_34_21]DAB27658.1 MAG TPA: transcription termination/antitermination protein NusA [Sulfurimonas sp. UBA10385]
MEKILDIVEAIAHEKGLKPEKVTEALKTAFVQTAKRVINSKFAFEALINNQTKTIDVIQIITVVSDNDEKLNDENIAPAYISISEAREYDDQVELDDQLQIPHDLEEYGRTAASTLHREIEYHVQRLVEDEIFNKYKSKIGTLITGRVTRVDQQNSTYIEVDEVRAVLPMKSRIKGEHFKVGDHLKAVVRRVNLDKENGIQIELSRTSPKFLEELLALEVPEISDGTVIIEKSARIPGERAKIALISTHPQVDAVGATVGVKGVRINAVSQELIGENIDCIEYTSIPELFISRIMSPAIISNVEIIKNDRGEAEKAIITLPSDQKSKAIGKNGINIRLASMLSGLNIELVENDGKTGKKTELEQEQKDGVDALKALFN